MVSVKFVVAVFVLSAIKPDFLTAQFVPPRSRDYLFVTNSIDPRGLWVNPAGLAMSGVASVLAEISTTRVGGTIRMDQWSLGLHSGGVGLGYRRSNPVSQSGISELSIASTMPFEWGALGVTVTRYSQDTVSARGIDIGAIFVANRRFQAGLAVRNIGRPSLLNAKMPIDGAVGLQWTVRVFQLVGEVSGAERLGIGQQGYDLSYRLGARYTPFRYFPGQVIAAAAFKSDGHLNRIHLGLAIGSNRRVGSVASATLLNNRVVADQLSASFLAINPATARR